LAALLSQSAEEMPGLLHHIWNYLLQVKHAKQSAWKGQCYYTGMSFPSLLSWRSTAATYSAADQGCSAEKKVWKRAFSHQMKRKAASNCSNEVSIRLQEVSTLGHPVSL